MLLRLLNLPWFVWTAAALLPLGTIGYALKFYRKYCRSLALWGRVAVLGFFQVMLFLVSFALIPSFAFIVNVVALPFEYFLLESRLKKLQIVSRLESGELPDA